MRLLAVSFIAISFRLQLIIYLFIQQGTIFTTKARKRAKEKFKRELKIINDSNN